MLPLDKSFDIRVDDHQQTVLVDHWMSPPCSIIPGVPQGSELGPLLFLVLTGYNDGEVALLLLSSLEMISLSR